MSADHIFLYIFLAATVATAWAKDTLFWWLVAILVIIYVGLALSGVLPLLSATQMRHTG